MLMNIQAKTLVHSILLLLLGRLMNFYKQTSLKIVITGFGEMFIEMFTQICPGQKHHLGIFSTVRFPPLATQTHLTSAKFGLEQPPKQGDLILHMLQATSKLSHMPKLLIKVWTCTVLIQESMAIISQEITSTWTIIICLGNFKECWLVPKFKKQNSQHWSFGRCLKKLPNKPKKMICE